MSQYDPIWPPEAIAQLTRLWDEGHSSQEIARRMGRTKNAIVGRVHRLRLPGRPSPIRRDGTATPRDRKIRAPKATLPTLTSVAPSPAPRPAPPAIVRLPGKRDGCQAAPQVFPPMRVAASPPTRGKCAWPLWGHHERPTHRFCDRGAVRGSYCAVHAATCYERRDRREDAA